MNINQLVEETLRNTGLEINYRKYSGSNDTYITFFEINNYDEDL